MAEDGNVEKELIKTATEADASAQPPAATPRS
jgi:hypothetical protein